MWEEWVSQTKAFHLTHQLKGCLMSARVACLLSFLLFVSESWTRPSGLSSKSLLNLNNLKEQRCVWQERLVKRTLWWRCFILNIQHSSSSSQDCSWLVIVGTQAKTVQPNIIGMFLPEQPPHEVRSLHQNFAAFRGIRKEGVICQ